jgi:hypothetical protein
MRVHVVALALLLSSPVIAAEEMGGKTGSGGSPAGQPTSPDSPTMGGQTGHEHGDDIGIGRRRGSGEATTDDTRAPGDHRDAESGQGAMH